MKGVIPLSYEDRKEYELELERKRRIQEAEEQAARVIEKQHLGTTPVTSVLQQIQRNKEIARPLPGWVRAAAELDDIKKMDIESEACTRRLQNVERYLPPEERAQLRKDHNLKTIELMKNLINKEIQK